MIGNSIPTKRHDVNTEPTRLHGYLKMVTIRSSEMMVLIILQDVYPEKGGMFIWNVGDHLQDYTAAQYRS